MYNYPNEIEDIDRDKVDRIITVKKKRLELPIRGMYGLIFVEV